MNHIVNQPTRKNTLILLLCGGRATRMGGDDKGLIEVTGIPLYQHTLQRLLGQVDHFLISANRHQVTYAQSGYPVIADDLPDYPGPLAGILAALGHSDSEWLLTVPCDMPLIPDELFKRFQQAVALVPEQWVYVAHDGSQQQHLVMLLHRSVQAALQAFIDRGQRAVHRWLDQMSAVKVDFSDQHAAFANINCPEDLQHFKELLT